MVYDMVDRLIGFFFFGGGVLHSALLILMLLMFLTYLINFIFFRPIKSTTKVRKFATK